MARKALLTLMESAPRDDGEPHPLSGPVRTILLSELPRVGERFIAAVLCTDHEECIEAYFATTPVKGVKQLDDIVMNFRTVRSLYSLMLVEDGNGEA